MTSAPPTATDGTVVSYCGPGFTTSVAALSATTPTSVVVTPPLNQCMPPFATLSIPAALIASQPPPSVSINASTAAALLAAYPGLSIQITQQGVSPRSETAGVSKLSYKALPAISDISIKSSTEAAASLAASQGLGIPSTSLPTAAAANRTLLQRLLAAAGAGAGAAAATLSTTADAAVLG